MIERCDLCGLFGCRHINSKINPMEPVHGSRNNNLEITNSFQVGEHMVDSMESFSGVPENKGVVSTIPMGPSKESFGRVLIPPPPAMPMIPGIFVNKELQNIDMKNEWVHCNICRARVCIRYLDQHLKVHTHNFEPSTRTSTSTALVASSAVASAIIGNGVRTSSYQHEKKEKKPVLAAQEPYKFRQLEQACCASSVSKNGRYSDFTIIFWEKEKIGVGTTTYTGTGTSYATKDWERFTIHIVYDSIEDYYTLNAKLLKRGQYSQWDNEDSAVPDRICFQEELLTEIKRALLFFRISPRSAYKHFKKLFNQPLVTDYDKRGVAILTQTKNCEVLSEKLKKSPTTWSGHGGAYDYSGCD